MVQLALLSLVSIAAALIVPRADDDPSRYTICGADRGYTEKDSLEAAVHLREKINTTIVSLCNGSARDRHINRAEVRRGIEQLIKDCGLIGGFTGFHVVNNLTFGAYGVAGGVNRYPPAGSPPPDTPGGSTVWLAKRDCSPIPYDGQPREGCDRKYELNDDGTCGDLNTDNGCQAYCELTRRYLLGPETKAPGDRGQRWAATAPIELTESKEYSISTGFDIGVEGIAKEIFAAGVSFSYSVTKTTGYSINRKPDEAPAEPDGIFGRWVFFPYLVETCGTASLREYKRDTPACPGVGVCPPPGEPYCSGDVETKEGVCSISPVLNEEGNPEAYWAVRWEGQDGKALDVDKQSSSYKNLCDKVDPDNDGQNECYTDIGKRSWANYHELEARAAAAHEVAI
ncbi:hypothetical protein MN608_03143 [Microdochium nivale]|nr:hypothetical protein MN608_03143 [Microdochium nivale]